MALPEAVRGLTPDSLRNSGRLRAVALRSGLIPPRTMHRKGRRRCSPSSPVTASGSSRYEGATRSVVERAARKRGGPHMHWHVALSEEAAEGWAQPLDFVFIDGDHSEEACLLDWELWNGHVEPGGAVAFHDARVGTLDGWGDDGPTAVVDRLFREEGVPGWEIVAERDSLVAVVRSSS